MENYSLSDLAAVTNGEGLGGNNIVTLLLLFALISGNGFFGNNRNNVNEYATAASQQDILFNQKFSDLGAKINAIGDGICSSTYALNNAIHSAQDVTSGAIISEGRALQTQLANCCCENQKNVDSVRFDMANYNAQTQAAIHAEGEATRAMIQQDKIECLQQKISALELQNAVSGVVRYPMASTYTSGVNPFCSCGCGCAN